MHTHHQAAVSTHVMQSFEAYEWPLIHDREAVFAMLAHAAPVAPQGPGESICPTWVDALLTVTSQHYLVPTPRGPRLQDALAHRYARIIVAGVLAATAPTQPHQPAQLTGRALFDATVFLREFPIDHYPLVPGDALTPRVEYREALDGAVHIAQRALLEHNTTEPG